MTLTLERPDNPRPIVDDGTRREFIAGGVSLAALLAGCGGGDDGRDREAHRVFTDSTGAAVRVPDRAKRIVATHDYNAGAQLLALGAPVVGLPVRDDGRIDPSIGEYFDIDGVKIVGPVYEPNLEGIAALNPDLIVHEAFAGGQVQFDGAGTLKALRKIAPVVAIDTFRPVEAVMADYVKLVGTEEATEARDRQRATFEKALGRLRGILGDRWRQVTASVVYYFEGDLRAYARHATSENDILDRLGVRWTSPHLRAERLKDDNSVDISLERIQAFDGDLLVLAGNVDKPLESAPVYKGLDVVRARQAIRIPNKFFGTHYPNLTALVREYTDRLSDIELRTDVA